MIKARRSAGTTPWLQPLLPAIASTELGNNISVKWDIVFIFICISVTLPNLIIIIILATKSASSENLLRHLHQCHLLHQCIIFLCNFHKTFSSVFLCRPGRQRAPHHARRGRHRSEQDQGQAWTPGYWTLICTQELQVIDHVIFVSLLVAKHISKKKRIRS